MKPFSKWFSGKSRITIAFLFFATVASLLPLGFAAANTYSVTVIPVVFERSSKSWETNSLYLLADRTYFNGSPVLYLTPSPGASGGASAVFIADIPRDSDSITIKFRPDDTNGADDGNALSEDYTIAKIGNAPSDNVTIPIDSDIIVPLFIMPSGSGLKGLVLYSPNGDDAIKELLPSSGFDLGDEEGDVIEMSAGEVRYYKSTAPTAVNSFYLVDNTANPPADVSPGGGDAPPAPVLDRTELEAALELAEDFLDSDLNFSAESLATLEAAIVAAQATLTTQNSIDEATAQLRAALFGLANVSVSPGSGPGDTAPVQLSLALSPASDLPADSTVAVDVLVSGASYLSTLVLDFEYSTDALGFEYAGGSADNSFKIISVLQDGGTISVAVMNPNPFSADTETPLARIRFRAAAVEAGDVLPGSVRLVSAYASSYVAGIARDTPVEIAADTVTMTVVPGLSPIALDFNGDGVITLADLTAGMPYYRVTSNDPEWATARKMDYDDDGIITVKDYALIVNEMRGADWGVFDR
ncbi:MAG: hypothetical protein LBM98_02930 [Oscillospiraceae bacterium]|nr:hypothetical protein [Oscillospiraceae bacterium]